MHMVDENYTALVNHAIGILVTNGAYILDPRFGSRLSMNWFFGVKISWSVGDQVRL